MARNFGKFRFQRPARITKFSFVCIIAVSLVLTACLWITIKDLLVQVYVLKVKNEVRFERLYAEQKVRKDNDTDVLFRNGMNEYLIQNIYCPDDLFLLILVMSLIENRGLRMAIRTSWGRNGSLKPRWKTVFLLSRSVFLAREALLFGDIIQENSFDNEGNKLSKMQSGLSWAVRSCRFQFLLKCDDNAFVNTKSLLNFLMHPSTPKTKFYTGHVNRGSRVARQGRYAVSKEDFPGKYFPSYCLGGGYILSQDLVLAMVVIFPAVKYFDVEDAYIGCLAARPRVTPVDNATSFRVQGKSCAVGNKSLVLFPVNIECMDKLFKETAN